MHVTCCPAVRCLLAFLPSLLRCTCRCRSHKPCLQLRAFSLRLTVVLRSFIRGATGARDSRRPRTSRSPAPRRQPAAATGRLARIAVIARRQRSRTGNPPPSTLASYTSTRLSRSCGRSWSAVAKNTSLPFALASRKNDSLAARDIRDRVYTGHPRTHTRSAGHRSHAVPAHQSSGRTGRHLQRNRAGDTRDPIR